MGGDKVQAVVTRKDEIRDAGLKRACLHESRDCVAAGPGGAGGLAKAIRPNPGELGWQVRGWGRLPRRRSRAAQPLRPASHQYRRGDVGCVDAGSLDMGINFPELAR